MRAFDVTIHTPNKPTANLQMPNVLRPVIQTQSSEVAVVEYYDKL